MRIRIVKPVAPIKINNHWVYRADDTIDVDLAGIVPYMEANFMAASDIDQEQEVQNVVELFIESKLEVKK